MRLNQIYLSLIVVVIVFLVTIPVYSSVYYLSLLMTIFLYTIMTLAWSLFSVPTGYISLGTAAFLGCGAYTTAVLGKLLPIPLVIIIGGLISFIFALLVGVSCLRLRGVYFSIFTFGLTALLSNTVVAYETQVQGTLGRSVINLNPEIAYYLMLIMVVIVLIFGFLLGRSKYGLALRSIGQAEEAAAHSGLNVNILKVVIFALTAFFMGLTGAIIVTQWSYVNGNTAFNMFYSFMPVLMAIFGGMQYVPGQILGAVALTLIEQELGLKFPYHYRILFGILILAFILFLPSGVFGFFNDLVKSLKRRMQKSYANP